MLTREKLEKWDVLIYKDVDNYSIAYDGNGGAIISGSNLEEVKSTFLKAMNFYESIQKLLYFKSLGTFPS